MINERKEENTMSANERQVAGAHYQPGATFQHWDYAVQLLDNRYLEGQITRYVVRHRQKDGKVALEKALHYVQKLEEEYKAGHIEPLECMLNEDRLSAWLSYCRQHGLPKEEERILVMVACWNGPDMLTRIAIAIRNLIQDNYHGGDE